MKINLNSEIMCIYKVNTKINVFKQMRKTLFKEIHWMKYLNTKAMLVN